VALMKLSDDFREHVEITEGADGLYTGVLATAPRLANAVTRLTNEHVRIRELLDQALTVTDKLDGTGGTDDTAQVDDLRELGTRLIGALVRHRQRGADLVYEAFESDIGGET
jgi:hypothetical protein